jgi:GR25 family glycosyltransferase involved in LPS biosynthesis
MHRTYIITHGPDYPLAEMATAALERHGFKVTWAIDHQEPVPAPHGDLITTLGNRRSNLNGGIAWVIEQLQFMLDHAQGAEWVSKVDSDTLILERKWFDDAVAAGYDAIGFQCVSRDMYGFCYCIKTSLLPELIRLARERGEDGTRAEDCIIAQLLETLGCNYLRHQYNPRRRVWGFWKGWPGPEEKLSRFQIVCVQRLPFGRVGEERNGSIAAMRKIFTMRFPDAPKKKNLTDWFSRVYVINCAHRPDRLERILKHLEESGMADVSKVHVFNAIIGDYTGHPAGWGGGNGAWGCLQSHRRLLEDAMHVCDDRGIMALESILILEDDCFFLDNALEKLNEFMPQVPADWGQIYLGGQHRRKTTPTVSGGVVIGNSVNRTHAHAISRNHIHKVYHHISYMPDYQGTNKHVDHQLELAHNRKDWPVYCPKRWIAGQEAGTSNISGKKNPRMIWA